MIDIRPVPVDAPDARALLEEYFALRASIFPGGAYRAVFPPSGAFRGEGEAFVVLYDDAEAAGCGAVRRLPDGARGARFEVKHLFVRDAGRGRGWGRLILDDLERRAREAGAAELVLDTHHTLEAAGALYARSGFIPTEPYNDNVNATRWYAKPLT